MRTFGGREPRAEIPFVIEAWSHTDGLDGESCHVTVNVNRTPITGEVRAYKDKGELTLFGCGLRHAIKVPARSGIDVVANVTTPYCPITTDGKEPDLASFAAEIETAIARSARRSARTAVASTVGSEKVTQKSVVLERLDEGVAKASGEGAFRFNQRQLFYVIRPFIINTLGVEPSWENFCQIITAYEEQNGDIPGMYRDPRGTLYHPHIEQDIALGTLAVEQYTRPEWTFNKVLYIEKEGFFEALKAARWPEHHDCALLTSKGFSTRAVRDFLDLLADDGEPVTVFCVHDADAFGTMIYQTLQEETRARPRRRVEVINLGLEAWEAVAMGLAVEPVKDREQRAAVADYVLDHPVRHWAEWLQSNRVELNAMTTPQFLEWLDAKMADHAGAKVIPPPTVLAEAASKSLAKHIRSSSFGSGGGA